jgi:hypothetical protein
MSDDLNTLSDIEWQILLRRIGRGRCTPFLGAGACAGRLPLAAEVARRWAHAHGYPLVDSDNLARVAQFVAVKLDDDVLPKEDLADLCSSAEPPDFQDPSEIHGVLADLPLPVYITTNYDDFMSKALRTRNRQPRRELCQWNEYVQQNYRSVFEEEPDYQPSIANPLVYHLHGYHSLPQSMVVTEDDYLEFLVWFAREWAIPDHRSLPGPIVSALAGTSLLFVGYSRADWSFRVVFRGLVNSLVTSSRMKSVAVQLEPLPQDALEVERSRARAYLNRYFQKIQKIPVSVFWGMAAEFAVQLRSRWEAYQHDDHAA